MPSECKQFCLYKHSHQIRPSELLWLDGLLDRQSCPENLNTTDSLAYGKIVRQRIDGAGLRSERGRLMCKTSKKRVRLTLDKRAADMLGGVAYLLTARNKRKVEIGEIISRLVINSRPDQWAVVREDLRK